MLASQVLALASQVLALVLLLLAVLLLILAGRSLRWPAPPRQAPGRLPSVAVLVPLAGPLPYLDAFLAALHDQDYPEYRIVLIIEKARENADDAQEAAVRVGALERAGLPQRTVIVRAERAVSSSQKAANLVAGLGAAGEAEVVVLADADALPHRAWLRDLVAPLAVERAAAGGPLVATGFRWYVPGHGLGALVRSAFSAGALSLLTDSRRAFAWGGSLALDRRDLERLGIGGIWRGALSDDMAVTRAVRAAGGQVRFVPECVVPSSGSIGWRALWEFAVRQIVMLRSGDPKLWATVLGMHVALALTQLGAIAAAAGWGSIPGGPAGRAAAVALLAAPTLLGVARARARFNALGRMPLGRVTGWDERRLAHIALAPIMTWFMLACLIAAPFRREIIWCGIRYRIGARGSVLVQSGP